MSPYEYHHLKAPAKSKQPFYATSEYWTDIRPIPLIEHGPPDQNPALGGTDPGPALATIAYSQRYLEAMSYLRALTADNEFSERALALTEDIIGMNPAHYTVWLYRMACLKHLWGVDTPQGQGVVIGESADEEEEEEEESSRDERIKEGIDGELEWLEGVSEKNLKNYQIWHHRQSLLTLLPTHYATSTFFSESEIPFLTHILSFDAKNYHVWTYRQWLCRHFPAFLLPPSSSSELTSLEALLDQDVRNNSAWSHRYFVVFGAQEVALLEAGGRQPSAGQQQQPTLTRKQLFDNIKATHGQGILKADEVVVEREIAFAKCKIALAPQNPSPWNYLKGVLRRAGWGIFGERDFCESFVRSGGAVGGSGSGSGTEVLDFMGDGVRSSHAIDWLAEIYAELGGEENRERARRCLEALADKWDPIRKNYWEYRGKAMERGEYAGT